MLKYGWFSQKHYDMNMSDIRPIKHYVQVGPKGELVMAWTMERDDSYTWDDKVLVGYYDPSEFKSTVIREI